MLRVRNHRVDLETLKCENARLLWFLGAFAKVGKATISFYHVHLPSVRMEQPSSH